MSKNPSPTVRKLQKKAMRTSWATKASGMTDKQVADALRKTSDPFIYSQEWRDLRKLAVARYGLICCKCGHENSKRSPINFDHIKPRKFFPELALDIENLQPLCGPCNRAKGNNHQTNYRKPA